MHLYVFDLSANVTMDEMWSLSGKFGSLFEEDTAIVRRSDAFVQYKNRSSAEKAKRQLEKTKLRGPLSVRYAEAQPLKSVLGCNIAPPSM